MIKQPCFITLIDCKKPQKKGSYDTYKYEIVIVEKKYYARIVYIPKYYFKFVPH